MAAPAWRELAALVLPTSCPGCGERDTACCERCAGAVLGAGPFRVPELSGWPRPPAPSPRAPVPVCSAAPYAGAVRELLVAWKEHGRHDLTPLLGRALAGAAATALREGSAAAGPAAAVLLVPVPSSRHAVRRRGAALVGELATATAGQLRRDGVAARVGPPALLRLARTPADQASLAARARAVNVRGAHRGGAALQGRVCVVLDDIVTTGSTLAEAVRAVHAAGGHVVGAATVAATPRGQRIT